MREKDRSCATGSTVTRGSRGQMNSWDTNERIQVLSRDHNHLTLTSYYMHLKVLLKCYIQDFFFETKRPSVYLDEQTLLIWFKYAANSYTSDISLGKVIPPIAFYHIIFLPESRPIFRPRTMGMIISIINFVRPECGYAQIRRYRRCYTLNYIISLM